MLNREAATGLIKQQGLLPLYYDDDAYVSIAIAKALYNGGVRVIEYTNRGKKALENFKALIAERDVSMPGLVLCMGTITTAEDATLFIEAGADVLISPVFDTGICDVAYMNKILWLPGCMTPTEIHVAFTAGCTLLKLFPGNVLQPHYVQAIRPLFPTLDFVVTGGVETSRENITEWFRAGVCGIGMGSKLITKKIIEEKNYPQITTMVKEILSIIQSVKC